jgi:hypothetical protein
MMVVVVVVVVGCGVMTVLTWQCASCVLRRCAVLRVAWLRCVVDLCPSVSLSFYLSSSIQAAWFSLWCLLGVGLRTAYPSIECVLLPHDPRPPSRSAVHVHAQLLPPLRCGTRSGG